MSVVLDVGALTPCYGSIGVSPSDPAVRRRCAAAVLPATLALVAVLVFGGIRPIISGGAPSSLTAASGPAVAASPFASSIAQAAASLPTAPGLSSPAVPIDAASGSAPAPGANVLAGLLPALDTSALPIEPALLPAVAAAAAGALLAALWARLPRRSPRPPWAGEAEGLVPAPPADSAQYRWGLWPSLPLQPYGRKVTLETEVVPGSVWTHDQVQGTVNVMVPVRQTVIRLKDGGLFVHNPVAPTQELLGMMRRLEERFGPVKHIVLGTLALEHKVPAGPFSRRFHQAQLWVMPGQYSYPLNLPNAFLGLSRTKTLPEDPLETPFGAEIDYAIFGPAKFPSIGAFGETAFYHKASRTLLVTDAVVQVDDEPPAILTEDPRALLFHARDTIEEEVVNDAPTRRRGWRRIVQFGLNFLPSALDVVPAGEAIADVGRRPPSMRGLGGVPFGLTPWRWTRDDRPSFRALQGGLLVAPILRELIFNRFPAEALEWADRVAQWPFQRIIPCHLSNDLRAGPGEFRAAFRFLEQRSALPLPFLGRRPAPLPEDGKLLQGLNESLTSAGVLPPPAPKV